MDDDAVIVARICNQIVGAIIWVGMLLADMLKLVAHHVAAALLRLFHAAQYSRTPTRKPPEGGLGAIASVAGDTGVSIL